MKERKLYILFFDYKNNGLLEADTVHFIAERLRFHYLKNLVVPLGENIFLVREDGVNTVDIYIQSAIDDLSVELSKGLSKIKHFFIPVGLENISEYVKHLSKEIEVFKEM